MTVFAAATRRFDDVVLKNYSSAEHGLAERSQHEQVKVLRRVGKWPWACGTCLGLALYIYTEQQKLLWAH